MKKLLLFFPFAVILLCNWSYAQPQSCYTEDPSDEPGGCFLCAPNYIGSTNDYTPGPYGLDFPCGTIQNNQWLSVIADSTFMSISIYAYNCWDDLGVQLIMYNTSLEPVSTCFSSMGMLSSGEITADNLTPGEVYWIMVDGFSGDMCDFHLSITEGFLFTFPDAAGPITQSPNISPVCTGQRVYFAIDPVPNAIFYDWYTPGATVVSGGSPWDTSVCLRFNSYGNRTVQVTPYRHCWPGASSSTTVSVMPLPPTVLPLQYACIDDFPLMIDGFWFSSPGSYLKTLWSSQGCDSLVRYNFALHPSTIDTLEVEICPGASFQLDTLIYNSPGTYQVVLENANQFGCDSFIRLEIMEIPGVEIDNAAQEIGCTDSCTLITADIDTSSNGFIYEWSTDNGVISGPTNILSPRVCAPGNYILSYSDTTRNLTCQLEAEVILDLGEMGELSTITSNSSSCVGDTFLIETSVLPLATSYEWVLSPDGDIIGNASSPTIKTAFHTKGTKEICARALSPCDTTAIICKTVNIIDLPTSSFNYDGFICQNESSTITYTGNAIDRPTFMWDFDGGRIRSGSGEGPYEISWDTPGTYTVRLKVLEQGCLSTMTEHSVRVNSILAPVIAQCDTATNTSVQISWNSLVNADRYEIRVNGISQGFQTGTVYYAINLNRNETFIFEVIATGSATCGPSKTTFQCSTTNCPIFYPPSGINDICEDDIPLDLPQDILVGSDCKWTGNGVGNDCRFYPDLAGAGPHMLYWLYDQGGCIIRDSIAIEVNSKPDFFVKIPAPIWPADSNAMELDLAVNGSGNFDYTWSNGQTTEDLTGLSPGNYCVTVTNQNGCLSEDCYQLIPNSIYKISSLMVICQGDNRQLTIRPSRGAAFSWSPSTGLSCTDCPNPIASPTQTTIYEVTATLPDGRSSTTPVFVIVLPPPFCPTSLKNDNENGWKEAAAKELQALEEFKDFNKIEILKWMENEADLTVENVVKIYPNPFTERIQIISSREEICQAEIYDSRGSLVYEKHFKSTQISVPLSQLPTGSYFIRIRTEGEVSVHKLLKN